MRPTLDWLTNPEVFAVNRETAHSDHIFFDGAGTLRQSLNGTWKFSYANNPEERKEEFYRCDVSTEDFDEILVPGHIQLQGYGRCQYVNMMYPWEGRENVTAPAVPKKRKSGGELCEVF